MVGLAVLATGGPINMTILHKGSTKVGHIIWDTQYGSLYYRKMVGLAALATGCPVRLDTISGTLSIVLSVTGRWLSSQLWLLGVP